MGLIRYIMEKITGPAGRTKKAAGRDDAAELGVILDHIPMAVYWKGADLVYKGGNAQFSGMTGIPLRDLPGKTDLDLHVREAAACFRQEDMEFLSGGRKSMYFTDKLVPMKDSPPMWVRTYKIPVFDDNSNIVYIMGLIQDVTKIKEDEIALAESESRLRTVLDATADHVVFVDSQGEVLLANDSFLSDFALERDKVVGSHLSDLISRRLYERLDESMRAAANSKEPCHFELFPHETPLGRYFDIAAYPVMGGGEAAGTAFFARDITERKQAEEMLVKHSEQLQAAMTEAENASKSKSEFLSRMSHEIRTPIGAITGMAKIAANTDDLDKIKDCLQKIDSSSKHLLGIINDVLDMSKIEADKFVLSDIVFRFEDMLKDVANVVGVQADEKRQDFEVILDSALPEYFSADELRLRQVIANLLSNAIKFTPEHGTIRLNVNHLGTVEGVSTVQVIVSDTGIGITAEQQERLFQPFEQAEGGIARKYGGTGLGLAICKKIVEMMGGAIRIESEPGAGSRFLFTVKMKARDVGRKETGPVIGFTDMRALVVDDSLETRQYLTHILEKFGISSEAVGDGYQAVEKVIGARDGGRAFNIFFVDWSMPGMDGIETTKRIKALMSDNAVVIMISITEWDKIEKQATEAGVARFIPKPLFPSTVLTVLDEIAGTPAKPEIKTGEKGIPDLTGYTVLLAEDIEINREIAAAILEPTHAEIDFAANGREAVGRFNANKDRYDLILMDIHMPEMDGYEATRLIRSNRDGKSLGIPIVAMTADAFKEDIDKCMAVGMNDHIAKPINESELFQKILICRARSGRYKTRSRHLPEADENGGVQMPCLNEGEALKRLDGDRELYKRLLKSFLEDTSRQKLAGGVAAGGAQNAMLALHAIKGMAANLSLEAVYGKAARLEAGLKNGLVDQNAVQAFDEAMDRTVAEIKRFLGEA